MHTKIYVIKSMAFGRMIYAPYFYGSGNPEKTGRNLPWNGRKYINLIRAEKIAVNDFLKGKDDFIVLYTAGI